MPRDGSPTRERILATAERLVIDNGFAATSLDQVIAASGTSKGSFFHHFSSKSDLAQQLVSRYVAADVAHLEWALDQVREVADPRARLLAFLRIFQDTADDLMSAQSSCLYVAALTEQQLVEAGTTAEIERAVSVWREAVATLIADAVAGRAIERDIDAEALADHLFVTFEGAFILCRATGDASHMRVQLRTFGELVEALVRP